MIELPYLIVRESLSTILVVGGPLFGAVLTVGLVMGALQSATQINDPALSFVPRIIALVGTMAAAGGWIIDSLATFFKTSVGAF